MQSRASVAKATSARKRRRKNAHSAEAAEGGASEEEADAGAAQTRQPARGALQERVIHQPQDEREREQAAAAAAFIGDGFLSHFVPLPETSARPLARVSFAHL